MKKIPTLFERQFDGHKVVGITDKVTPGMEWVLEGEGEATVKFDGAACAIIAGTLCKRYDAKNGKKAPEGAIPCCDPDPVTGHHPHWLACDENNPADKWFFEAYKNTPKAILDNSISGTYEACGPHFRSNPYDLEKDVLVPHGMYVCDVERSFEGIKKFLAEQNIEGIVFWKDYAPQCKIKRTDFGFEWPVKDGDAE